MLCMFETSPQFDKRFKSFLPSSTVDDNKSKMLNCSSDCNSLHLNRFVYTVTWLVSKSKAFPSFDVTNKLGGFIAEPTPVHVDLCVLMFVLLCVHSGSHWPQRRGQNIMKMQTGRGRSTPSSSLSGQPLTTTYVLCTMLTYMLSFYTQWCNTAGDITRVWHVRLCVQGQKRKRIRRKAPPTWTLQGVRVLWRLLSLG